MTDKDKKMDRGQIKYIEKFLNADLYFVVYEMKKQLHTIFGNKERCESVVGDFGNTTVSIVKDVNDK